MKPQGTRSNRSGYKLSHLCRASGFHPSTVHYYVKIGLLHKPRKIGLGLYLYDESHLRTLAKIQTLRRSENLPLAGIKDRLESDPDIRHGTHGVAAREVGPGHSKDPQPALGSDPAGLTRTRILDAATTLFSKKGYEGTRVSDITDALEMSKGSFYLYFNDKRELFMDCIERLADLVVPKKAREESSKETDCLARQGKRAVAFLEAFPSYAGILNLVKMAAMGEDPVLAQKAKEAFARIVKPIQLDLRRAVAQGMVREVDEELFAFLVLGMAENAGYKLITDPRFDLCKCVEQLVGILAHGVLARAGPSPEITEPPRRSGKITDIRGDTVKVREIFFGGKPYLAGRIGEGEIRVDTEKIAFILLDHTGPECPVQVTMVDGEKSRLQQDGNMIVTAASSVGLYTIPLRRVRSISFE